VWRHTPETGPIRIYLKDMLAKLGKATTDATCQMKVFGMLK
jgi:hypothetical protein